VPQKVDNDMDSSDLGFSEHDEVVDEHAYQIGELGQFEIERSLSDEVEGINREQSSVDFSEGLGGLSLDLDQLSHEADIADDSSYSTSSANQLSEDSSFYSSSLVDDDSSFEQDRHHVPDAEYEWERFV